MTRITNGMLVSNYMTNTNRNLNNMQKLQNQLSSGKEISKVSDLVMSEVANSLKRNFVNYDLTKKGQMNTIISSILYWAFLLLGGK